MTDWGTYQIYSSESKSNHPANLTGSGFMLVSGWDYRSDKRVIQNLVTVNGIARRTYISAYGWDAWKIVYDESILTNSTLLSPLAAALGATVTVLTASNDLNNIVTPGQYEIANGQAPANSPSWAGLNTFILVRMIHNSSRLIQFAWETNNTKCGYRRSDDFGSTWTPWSRNYDDSILADSTVLSPLASALGVSYRYIQSSESVSASSLGGGFFVINRASSLTDAPNVIVSTHALLLFRIAYGAGFSSVLFDLEGGGLFCRYLDSSQWKTKTA